MLRMVNSETYELCDFGGGHGSTSEVGVQGYTRGISCNSFLLSGTLGSFLGMSHPPYCSVVYIKGLNWVFGLKYRCGVRFWPANPEQF